MKITTSSVSEVPQALALLQKTKKDGEYLNKSCLKPLINTMFNCKTSGKSSLLTKEPALRWDSAAVELCGRRTWP